MGDEFEAAMRTIITLDDLRRHVIELWGGEDGIGWKDEGCFKARHDKGTIEIPRSPARSGTHRPSTRSVTSETAAPTLPTGNPGGSPEATRRAFNKRFLLDLAEDWQQPGRAGLQRVPR